MRYSWPPQNPAEDLDYEIDWSAWLAPGEVIVSHEVHSEDPSVFITRSIVTGGVLTFWVTGGDIKRIATIECEIKTSLNRTYALSPLLPFSK